LGLAHLVFPGAGYSRFSHSIGACHNAGQILKAISRNSGEKISKSKIVAYRLAGLLHDIGHYPFSHATEHVIENYYAKTLLAIDGQSDANQQSAIPNDLPPSFDHENLGEQILKHDGELRSIFERHGFEINTLEDIFSKGTPDPLIGIISSDLDCDRLDYLRRTAHFSGAPYGSVDIKYIIEQATVDDTGQYCFLQKAMRAADHLLVSRYYDYMQVPFNKTVAAVEWSLVSCINKLLKIGKLDCSAQNMICQIQSGDWYNFDDQNVFEKLRELVGELSTSTLEEDIVIRDHARAILNRRPAKMIAAWEEIKKKGESSLPLQLFEKAKKAVAAKFGISPDRFYVWKAPLQLSKIAGETDHDHLDDVQKATAVKILATGKLEAELLISRRDALLSQLSNFDYSGRRVYYLPESDGDSGPEKAELYDAFVEEVCHQPSGR
jgi:hypothetical protein